MIFSSTLFFCRSIVNIGYYSLISIIYTHIIVFQKVVLYSNPFVGHKTDNIFSFFTPIKRSEIDVINEYNIKNNTLSYNILRISSRTQYS